MTIQMPSHFRTEMFDSIESRLRDYMPDRVFPEERATTVNFVLYNEFQKLRKDEQNEYSLNPVFVGEYFVDPNNPYQTRVYSHQGTEACSPIPIKRGVIGRAIRTGKDQYVPDVTKDANHVGCDPTMEGSELVLLTWSDPYPSGPYKGFKIPLAVLDLDFHMKNALELEDISRLRGIWDVYGKKIFPGKPRFMPRKVDYEEALRESQRKMSA